MVGKVRTLSILSRPLYFRNHQPILANRLNNLITNLKSNTMKNTLRLNNNAILEIVQKK